MTSSDNYAERLRRHIFDNVRRVDGLPIDLCFMSGCISVRISSAQLSVYATPYWEGEELPIEISNDDGTQGASALASPNFTMGDISEDARKWEACVLEFLRAHNLIGGAR